MDRADNIVLVMVVREAAQFLGISRQAIYQLWQHGTIHAISERPLRFSIFELERYRAQKEARRGG